MRKKIVLISAIRVITDELEKVFSETIPDVEIIHIVDEGILQFDIESKKLKRRLCNLAVMAEEIGADAIVITCAHALSVVSTVQTLVGPPVTQITLPMIEAAVKRGETIGLVATEEPIIKPIVGLLEKAAERAGKRITIKIGLCEEAFKARLSGDTAKSDELLLKTIRDISNGVDVVVLAQVSSGRVAPKAREQTDKPILSPAKIAAEKIKTMLG
jgi:aspartate/glutamate racemase